MALYEGWEWFFFFTSIRTFLSFRDGSYYSLRCAINFKRICPTHICQRHPPYHPHHPSGDLHCITAVCPLESTPPASQSSTLQKQKPQTNIHIYKIKIQLSDPPQINTGCPKCVSEYCWRPKILTKIECCGAMNMTWEHWSCFLSKKRPKK